MTFSLKLCMSNVWRLFKEIHPWVKFAFVLLLFHSFLTGLTDDEAYYWVLSRHLAWGYAYHPPAMAWMIAIFTNGLGWISQSYEFRSFCVRLPAVLSALTCLLLMSQWVADVFQDKVRDVSLGIFSFVGIYALCWMMVPDVPLLLGWTLLFVMSWKFINSSDEPNLLGLLGLMLAVAWTLLSKFSGLLAIISVGLSFFLWAPKNRKTKLIASLLIGSLMGIIPTLIWNSQHDWASLAYQFHNRHSGAQVSWMRYLRFILIQLFVTGPLLFFGPWILLKDFLKNKIQNIKVIKFIWIWFLPGSLFLIQPLFSDFKPHWAIVAWWPIAAAVLGATQVRSSVKFRLARVQMIYSAVLFVLVLGLFRTPWLSALGQSMQGGQPINPNLDISNDVFGWPKLAHLLNGKGIDWKSTPFTGARYQTASQAAFSLNSENVSLIPRGIEAKDEWPNLSEVSSQGPDWPVLLKPVFYVSDNRYQAPPEFKNSKCDVVIDFNETRELLGRVYPSKEIKIWRCNPAH